MFFFLSSLNLWRPIEWFPAIRSEMGERPLASFRLNAGRQEAGPGEKQSKMKRKRTFR